MMRWPTMRFRLEVQGHHEILNPPFDLGAPFPGLFVLILNATSCL